MVVGTIIEWLKQPGDGVNESDTLCLIETDKITVDYYAKTTGTVVEHLASVDETVEVGQPLVRIAPGEATESSAPPALSSATETPSDSEKSDTKDAPASAPAPSKAASQTAPSAPTPSNYEAVPTLSAGSRNEERVKMSRMVRRQPTPAPALLMYAFAPAPRPLSAHIVR